jgi:hypothetical protein
MKPTRQSRRSRHTRTIAKARDILFRVEELDTCGCWDFENTRNRELAVLQLELDLLAGRHLTRSGLRFIKELIGYSEQWIDDAETDDTEEA